MSDDRADGRGESLRELGDAFATVTALLLERGSTLEQAVSAFESGLARAALVRHGGNLTQAAAALGIHRNTLRGKLHGNGRGSKGA